MTARVITAGWVAVAAWSREIHGSGPRHAWAIQCADMLDELGPAAELPALPGATASTAAEREDTLRRHYLDARELVDEPAPPAATQLDLFALPGDDERERQAAVATALRARRERPRPAARTGRSRPTSWR